MWNILGPLEAVIIFPSLNRYCWYDNVAPFIWNDQMSNTNQYMAGQTLTYEVIGKYCLKMSVLEELNHINTLKTVQ